MNFKPVTKIVHDKILPKDIPSFFSDNIHITNTQNIFGLYIDALITRHIQYLNNDQIISYQDLNKLILIHYKQSKSPKQFLDDLDQFEQLRKIYNLNDMFFRSSILFDMIKDDTIKINKPILFIEIHNHKYNEYENYLKSINYKITKRLGEYNYTCSYDFNL
jgi:hypothetical protein